MKSIVKLVLLSTMLCTNVYASDNFKETDNITKFYRGEITISKKSFEEIINSKNVKDVLEALPILFPTKKPSAYKNNVPLLTDEIIVRLKEDKAFKANYQQSIAYMTDFYGFKYDPVIGSIQIKDQNASYTWINSENPNFLILTRMLDSMYLLGFKTETRTLFNCLKILYEKQEYKSIIGEKTFKFWGEAAIKDDVTLFYKGILKNPSKKSFNDIMGFDKNKLEIAHDFIQYIFPTMQRSIHAPNAPLLTNESINELRGDKDFKSNYKKSISLMANFYGFTYDPVKGLIQIKDENASYPWMNSRDHNFLRLTRMLQSMRFLGFATEAQNLFNCLKTLYDKPNYKKIIGETSFNFWFEAAKGEDFLNISKQLKNIGLSQSLINKSLEFVPLCHNLASDDDIHLTFFDLSLKINSDDKEGEILKDGKYFQIEDALYKAFGKSKPITISFPAPEASSLGKDLSEFLIKKNIPQNVSYGIGNIINRAIVEKKITDPKTLIAMGMQLLTDKDYGIVSFAEARVLTVQENLYHKFEKDFIDFFSTQNLVEQKDSKYFQLEDALDKVFEKSKPITISFPAPEAFSLGKDLSEFLIKKNIPQNVSYGISRTINMAIKSGKVTSSEDFVAIGMQLLTDKDYGIVDIQEANKIKTNKELYVKIQKEFEYFFKDTKYS